MGYVADRDLEQLTQFDAQISQFIRRHKQHRPAKRKTIILFPGGLGSSLTRSRTPNSTAPYFYDSVWVDCPLLFGGALLLKMSGEMDDNRHFVISDGCVRFPAANLVPYDGFLDWCTLNGFDWFAFGWDWRRRPDVIADFFLNQFAPRFQEVVSRECGVDPFDDVTLIGHSFGGMVVKLALNQGGEIVDALTRAITVGSPFYGYAGQLNRYFKGDPDIERLSFKYNERNLVELISSLRGPYTLLYLDEATFRRDQAALAQDRAFPLRQYPLTDHDTGAIADPYNPGQNGSKVRYPCDWGFDKDELDKARQTYKLVAKPLTGATRQKFFNIRAVQTRRGANAFETIHEQTWKWISPDFDPGRDDSPITDDSVCPGDGVIPAWSARLVSTPSANVRTVRGDIERDKFEHMDLMLSPLIQAQIFDIMQ